MGAREQEQKQSFWGRYKFYIIGLVGALLLIGSMSVQNIIMIYKTSDGEQFAVKLDYSAYGICLRCFGTTDNAGNIVEKAMFFGVDREESVKRAADGLSEIAGEEGTIQIRVGGVLGMVGGNEKLEQKLIMQLEQHGYQAEIIPDRQADSTTQP